MDTFRSLQNLVSTWIHQVRQAPLKQLARGLLQLSYHAIFWGWNSLFLMVVYLGFLPFIGVPLVRALVAGEVPFPFVVPLASFLVVPPVCAVMGLTKLRKRPTALIRLFYGVEAPIMALCIFRMFILRELTPASTLMVVAGAVAIAAMTLELIFGYAAYSKGLAAFQMVTHTVVLLTGVYVGGFLLFYTIPILWMLLGELVGLQWVGAIVQALGWAWQSYQPRGFIDLVGFLATGMFQSLLMLGIFALFGFSATLFVGMPYALVMLFAQSWGRIRHAFGQQFGHLQAWVTTGGVVIASAALFVLTSPQPQALAFDLLSQPPESAAARQALMRQSPQIRQGLLNAYLMPYRYVSTWQSANNLEDWYPRILPLTPDQARMFQHWHNALLSPFLYQGGPDDPDQAADLYAQFFDTPIQKAESEAIQHALQSTVERDSVEASLLNISDRVVALTQQEVTVKPAGDWAEVTLFERYENFTPEDQEIVYQFSLPESAVFTGLWLGEEGLAERYPFVVSPRGAAQKVYQQEIERSQQTRADDPALLEQVGPRQYRLRVFPIPRRVGPGRPGVTHLWMTYEVAQQNGAWPLPQLTEKRNLYWTKKTERRRLGQPLKQAADLWYEPALPAETAMPSQVHQTTLAAGYTVTATPLTAATAPPLQNQRLAVLIDTSRSMGDRTDDLAQALQEVAAIAPVNEIDWFITSDDGMPAQKLTTAPLLQNLSFYGSLPLTTQLQQLDDQRQGSEYDAIFVLTDAGNYELEDDQASVPKVPGTLWLVHLGGKVPTAYADALQQHLATVKGGVTTTLSAAANRFAIEQQTDGTVMDGYQWAIAPTPQTDQVNAKSDFQPLAARQVIRWLSRSRDVTQVEELDQLHAIAQRTAIVTPYSSMLVLVNDRQREALKAAENDLDRFDRAIEDGEDTLTNPGDPLNTAVPETGTPIAILGVGALLVWVMGRSRRQSVIPRKSP